MKARGAFTLVELLVVIGVIAIVAAILLPVLNKAKQTVVTAQCLNNMKQLQRCYLMYAQNNNGWLPWNGVGGGAGGVTPWISGADVQTTVLLQEIENGALYAYNPNVKVYNCPANLRTLPTAISQVPQARQEYNEPGITFGTLLPQTRTCSINFPLGGFTAADPGPGALLATGVHAINKYSQMIAPNPNPAHMFVFCDENEYSVDDGIFAVYPAGPAQTEWWNMPGARHNRGTTWSFADGHTEYWKWHGTTVPGAEIQYTGANSPADASDDLARVQACTCPLGN